MTAPTKASLQRELRKERKESTKLRQTLEAFELNRIREQGEADKARLQVLDMAARHANENAAIKKTLRPVLAYFGEQWIGDRVRKEYQELVQFAKGGGDE